MNVLIFLAVVIGIPAILHFLVFKPKFAGFEKRLLLVTVVMVAAIYTTALAWVNSVTPPKIDTLTNKPIPPGIIFRTGVDLGGGSVIVYEVSEDFWKKQSADFRQTFDSKALASRIKTRIDPNNLLEVTIRPISSQSEDQPPRIEVIMPVREGDIEQIKNLITQQGVLEFRILAHVDANESEFADKDAIAAAEKELVDFRVEPGKEPPAPIAYKDDYQWVELSTNEVTHLQRASQNFTTTGKPGFEKVILVESDRSQQRVSTIAIFHATDQAPTNYDGKEPHFGRHFVLTRRPFDTAKVTGDNLDPGSIRVDLDSQSGQLVIYFSIRTDARDRFYELTKEVHQYMSIIFDGKVISAPVLQARLSDGGRIQMGGRGESNKRQVENLARILQAGSLPAALNPEPVSEKTMAPGLGEDTIRKGAISVAAAFLAVVIFMIWYYKVAGFVAIVALFANLLLTIAFMAFANAVFTLPGLAGLVLMLAMAVDANVLIYERLREEMERGANLGLAIRNAYDRAFPTIIDTHLTSIFTAIVLYVVGNDQLKGFGISLTVGLVISLFTSLYMTRLFFDIALNRRWIKSIKMHRLFSKPNIDFMGVRYYWFTATIILSIIGIVIFFGRGEAGLNIDFTGGTAYSFKFEQDHDISEVRKAVSSKSHELPEPKVDAMYPGSTVGTGPTRTFTLRTTSKNLVEVRETIKTLFQGQLTLVHVDITPPKPLANDPDKMEKSIELSFKNKSVTKAELEKAANDWLKKQNKAESKVFIVEASEADKGDHALSFKKLNLKYKLPAEIPDGDKSLIASLAETFNQPYSDGLEKFDSSFARQTQVQALMAILLSWLAISLYLTFRFHSWRFGAAAVLCLIHDLTFTLGLIGICHYIVDYVPWLGSILLLEDFKIDLPAVAAMLTLVGYSVNDTIVVFDRIREVRGKNPDLTPQMINDSVNQTLSRTILTSLVTFLVVVVLYIFGGEGVKLFSFVMVVGVIVGTYSSIFVASPLLLILGEGAPVNEPKSKELVAKR